MVNPPPDPNKPPLARRIARFVLSTLRWISFGGLAAWSFGALHYDFPVLKNAVSLMFLLGVLAALIVLRETRKKLTVVCGSFLLVLAWWLTQQPRNDRNWQPDVAQAAWAEIKGDEITLHNVRNCEYRTATDYTPQWETRTVRLSQMTGVDIFVNYWGSPYMAHPIVSFQFADALPLCFSIETRKEVGEKYSAIGGIYRQYELIYTVADERDVVRLRTNYRKDEESYLYHTKVSPDRARTRFMEYITTLNSLCEQPRWYNAITTNCTTAIRSQHPASERLPWDWRMLVNGKGDEMLYEQNGIVTEGLPFAELKRRALINTVAQAADRSPDFSRLIRADRPGFTIAATEKKVEQAEIKKTMLPVASVAKNLWFKRLLTLMMVIASPGTT